MSPETNRIIIVGGGAAGFFSAIHNKQNNPDSSVIIIEKSPEVLAKVKISGGGRCNVTHACFEPKKLCEHYPRGAKELLGPFHHFQPQDTIDWFESHGVPLKIEVDNRVFPQSDSSQSIIDCLVKTASELGIKLWTQCHVTHIEKNGTEFHLSLADRDIVICDKLVLATGSSRVGHGFAESLGHTIVPPIPSLFTFKINDKSLHALSGLAVEKAQVWIAGQKKAMQQGPVLVTHWGMSGPGIIKLSAWQAVLLHEQAYKVPLSVNWLPRYEGRLLAFLTQFQVQNPKKTIAKHSPFSEIPHRLWEYLAFKAGVSMEQTWNQLNSKQLDRLEQELNHSEYSVEGKGVFKEEFVNCGGVNLKEIHFKTMESKCCSGLHVIGELLNIDGITGGFNFQNAWTTGYLSGGEIIRDSIGR